MLTLLGYGLLAVLVAVGLFFLAAWLLPAGEQIAPVIRDEPIWQLPPDRRLDVDAVAAVKLPVAIRGYRFAETDLLLDRLGEELRERDAEIARLRADLRSRSSPDGQSGPEGESGPVGVAPESAAVGSDAEAAEVVATEAVATEAVATEVVATEAVATEPVATEAVATEATPVEAEQPAGKAHPATEDGPSRRHPVS